MTGYEWKEGNRNEEEYGPNKNQVVEQWYNFGIRRKC